ncbi:MAG: Gfo/Idh/MocA family oxidoreductase [Vampirovibrionales bacterium]|nr:Gfo/Idh/MocA family oxidoreductase [Vampirovibrionales bacterium]
MLNVGIIGYGYWGPNIVRNFHAVEGAQVTFICDRDIQAVQRAHKMFPGIQTSTCHEDVLKSPKIDIVAIATPVSAHYPLAKEALLNGKHVFVEKPFTATSEQAEELIALAEKKNLTIMVDHTFLFTGAVLKIKELLENDILGKVLYYDSSRVNLGLFQSDVNVVWDLAPHDFSILNFLLEEQPVALSAHGIDFFSRGSESAAFVTAYFSDNRIAHFNFNWFSPVKIRRTLIGGTKKMLVWNDLVPDEKVRIYDKGVDIQSKEGIYDALVQYRTGDVFVPKLDMTEPLIRECQYFIDCVQSAKKPLNDGQAGLKIVRMLEACDRSLKQKGALVELSTLSVV